MKRYIITLFITIASWQTVHAMSYEQARQEALYLTDKMAYELNLNDQQYNDAYEINLDYLLSLNAESDLYEDYLSYRLSDLRHILYDWQYNLLIAADYFIRPVYWRSGGWYFSIYNHYNHGYFYYSYPAVYYSYRGGHGRIHYHHGFYVDRRPSWNGGLRGNQPIGINYGRNGRGSTLNNRGGRIHGDGYHFDVSNRGNNRRGYERSDRGNSFSNSSSRNLRNDFSRRGGDESINHRGNENTSPRTSSEMTRREGFNSDRTNRNYGGSRNTETNRNYGGSRGISGGYSNPRSSGSNGSFGGSRSSGMNRGGFSSPGGSSTSRGGFSGGSRGGFSGGSRGGSSGGSVSRGRR